MLSFKPNFLLSSFTFIKRLFSSSLLSAIRVVSSELLIFLLAILIPACASASLAFHMMYSAYKLNKQDDNIQPWRTPFPVWSQSVVPCPVLTVASWPAYRFLRRQNSLWSTQSKALASQWSRSRCFFLELSCFFFDPTDVGNSISVSSAFSKFSLNIWKLLVHILLNPGLENFEHYFARVWNECNCVVVWTFLMLPFFGIGMKNWPFPGLWPLLSFPNLLAYWVAALFFFCRLFLLVGG